MKIKYTLKVCNRKKKIPFTILYYISLYYYTGIYQKFSVFTLILDTGRGGS